MYRNYYVVQKEKDGPVIVEGASEDIVSYFRKNNDSTFSPSGMVQAIIVRGQDMYHDHYISVDNTKRPLTKKEKAALALKQKKEEKQIMARPKSKFQCRLTEIETMLDRYGNTSASKNPKKYVEKLKEDGYLVDVEYRPKREVHAVKGETGNGSHTETWNEIWILTLKEKLKKDGEFYVV